MIAGGIIATWAAAAAILLTLIPGPYKKTDYLVVGAIATFLSMGLLFVVAMQVTRKPGEPLFGARKPRQSELSGEEPAPGEEPRRTPQA